jgi:hypothetical protein
MMSNEQWSGRVEGIKDNEQRSVRVESIQSIHKELIGKILTQKRKGSTNFKVWHRHF